MRSPSRESERAIARANVYVEAGADVIFVEAPRNRNELAMIPRQVPAPCLVNIVEGGKTPLLPVRELEALGFKLVLYANLALRVAAKSVELPSICSARTVRPSTQSPRC